MHSINEDTEKQWDSQHKSIESFTSHPTDFKLIPSGLWHYSQQDAVSKYDEEDNHEGEIGPEIFPPGFGNRKGQQTENVHEIGEQKDNVGLRGVQNEVFLIDISLHVDSLTTSILVIDLDTKLSIESQDHRDLSDELDDKHEDDLEDIGEAEEGIVGDVSTQEGDGAGVAEGEEEEKVAG